MIFLLKGEIVYAPPCTPRKLRGTGKKGGGEIGDLFVRVAGRMEGQRGNHFTISGRRRSRSFQSLLPLQRGQAELKRTGEQLGYLRLGNAGATILLYLEQLDLTIGYLREHKQERSRLYTSLGIMGGIFLTIMMY